ncbi:NAD(P)-binding protein [Ophiobolus disseminans]|uniref:NAD(P)-binding protein n=1 Tax=Ophiobolus disseminans TaxID=1469910 RepID=A0A6A6ZG74_9PLEO|nr:NAD(P)-binding protein [Ophiobolus disseminans]
MAKPLTRGLISIDALVNNAAILGDFTAPLSQQMTAAFLTNATGPTVVVQAFTPLLAKSTKTPRIVNVTSGAGSISLRVDYTNEHQKMVAIPYRTSKAVLNMVTVCQAYEHGPKGWKVFAYCPGHTESDLGPMNKVEFGAKLTSEGAGPMVGIIAGERDGEHGGFLRADGQWAW